jgi:hypothetical protein
MARIFAYEYLGTEDLRTVVKADPDEKIAIPENGKTFVQNGKTWRVVSVKFVGPYGPERESSSPMVVLVSLAPLRSQ